MGRRVRVLGEAATTAAEHWFKTQKNLEQVQKHQSISKTHARKTQNN